KEAGELWLAYGLRNLMKTSSMQIRGLHNMANALAAFALGRAVGLDEESMIKALQEFPGLPHRCQLVASAGGVDYVNDSKGTNLGATEAALKGLAGDVPNIVLIAGGDGKGADFSSLA